MDQIKNTIPPPIEASGGELDEAGFVCSFIESQNLDKRNDCSYYIYNGQS